MYSCLISHSFIYTTYSLSCPLWPLKLPPSRHHRQICVSKDKKDTTEIHWNSRRRQWHWILRIRQRWRKRTRQFPCRHPGESWLSKHISFLVSSWMTRNRYPILILIHLFFHEVHVTFSLILFFSPLTTRPREWHSTHPQSFCYQLELKKRRTSLASPPPPHLVVRWAKWVFWITWRS